MPLAYREHHGGKIAIGQSCDWSAQGHMPSMRPFYSQTIIGS